MTLQQMQEKNLAATTFLSHLYLEDKMISPLQVISVLNEHGISFVLVGLHGYVTWLRQPRATMDVDVIVAARQVKKAVKVLLEAFADLEAVDLDVVTRLKRKDSDEVLIDVMKPIQQPHREIFKNAVMVEEKGQRYRIPTLEMALVMKFAPMVSLNRADEDKYQDAHDFIRLVKNNPDIELHKLQQIAEGIYSGAGKEIVEMVRKVPARGETGSLGRRRAMAAIIADGYFARTALLSSSQMPGVVPVADVIRILNAAKVRFVLVGAYGLAEWRKESRATEDVDVIVAVKQLKKAVTVLTKAWRDVAIMI